MLFRAIKHQVDKGPVDAVSGKAKYTLNDNRLLREDVEYRTLVRTHFTLQTEGGVQPMGSPQSIPIPKFPPSQHVWFRPTVPPCVSISSRVPRL